MPEVTKLFLIIPLWGIFLFTVGLVFISLEAGILLGKKHRLSTDKEDRSSIGSTVGATLGLLAFLLAFTFGFAASKFDERRVLVLDEANAIGTTYLRAGYIGEPHKSEVRKLLHEYVTVRLEALLNLEKLEEGIKKSEEIQNQLWQIAVVIAEKNPGSEVLALFIQSLNEVIDLHSKRVNIGVQIRIPFIIWSTLYIVTILSIGSLGYQIGVTHTHYRGLTVLLILIFSTVITLIADLDRPQEGLIRVSQQSLIDLNNKFKI